ncbi:MAG: thiamine pyrophosphate-binding protein [Oligoflexia bacterium]|nr:thiamine pyrophosphate-binding protein [Oligoflexia bacterium]
MSITAGELVVECLMDWGVDTVFGIPGDGINGVIEGFRKHKDKIRFIHVRHEEAAAFAACAYAKYTGKLGVCVATSGPGGIHLLNGLYDAKSDGAPVLAITGMHFHDLISTHAQQDVELDKVFQDVSVYNARVMGPNHVENVMELACRTAMSEKGVSHVTIPIDFQEMKVERKFRSERNVPHHVSYALPLGTAAISAGEDDLRKAAAVLNEGRKIVILAGQGALDATDELLQAAELLGAPIVKPLLGKAAVPDDSIFTTGGIGLLGTRPSADAIDACDTIFMIGTSFPYMEYMPKPDQARGVQIDSDGSRLGLRFPIVAGLVGDSQRTLQALLPLLQRNPHREFLHRAQDGMKKWWELMKERGTRMDIPMKPQVVAWELGKRLSQDAIVSCDSGTIATWFARQIPARRGQRFSLSGNLATMAPGLPYAIAAAVAYPGRQSVAFVGDGGFEMLMAEFATCVQYNLDVKVVVVKNNTLGQIKWEQMVFLGNPEYACDLSPIDFTLFAQACGGKGFRIEDPKQCGGTLEEALNTPGPVLIEAVVDPLEAPMPARVTSEQALKFGRALARGEPAALKIARTIGKDQAREMI